MGQIVRPSVALLDGVNWDFPTSLPGVGTSLHWYPGTFPNALPATLVQAFTRPGGLVFDPYSGVGTTAYEALRQGRRAVATDANPVAVAASLFACFLVAAKRANSMVVSAVLNELAVLVDREEQGRQSQIALSVAESCSLISGHGLLGPLAASIANTYSECVAGTPCVELLSPWIHSETLAEIVNFQRLLVGHRDNPVLQLGGMVMISAVLRAVSSQTSSWGHVADNVRPKEMTYKAFYLQCRNWIARTSRMLRETQVSPFTGDGMVGADIRLFNWLNPIDAALRELGGQVDLMVTSPPYGAAIDYTLSQRLSHYFFGYTDERLMALVSGEIGARRKRFQSGREEIWATELATGLEVQLDLMKSNGVVCVVLPHKESGRLFGSIAFDVVMKGRKWKPFWTGSRSIRQSRTRQSWTSIQNETIQVFVGKDY